LFSSSTPATLEESVQYQTATGTEARYVEGGFKTRARLAREYPMNDQQQTPGSSRDGIIAALGELIEALDRRVPHIERMGEAQIAREAAALRREALKRIERLNSVEANRQISEAELADALMTDDGGPAHEDDGRR
jgi:hypothetical protein